MKQVLLVIDMLNDFVLPGAPLEVPHNREVLPAISRLIENARQAGMPVVYVCDAHTEDDPEFSRMGWPPHAVVGTTGAEVVASIAPGPDDIVVTKRTYASFYQTGLGEVLQRLGAEELIVTGCVSNICVMSAVADAALRGYSVRVPKCAVASIDPAEGEFAFRQMATVYGAVVEEAGGG